MILRNFVRYFLRGSRNRVSTQNIKSEENTGNFQKIKFTQEQLTEMGQYKQNPRARNIRAIYQDKAQQKQFKQYLSKQKQRLKNDQFAQQQLKQKTSKPLKREKVTPQVKRQKLRTFKIYKHIDKIRQNQQKRKEQQKSKQIIGDQRLQQLVSVRLIQQYLPYEYMVKVQKIFHKYQQSKLRDIAFHFTNLMKMRYSQQKINYDHYAQLSFGKLQQKLPFNKRVDQIYLTSKQKALQNLNLQSNPKEQINPDNPQIPYTQNVVISYLLNRVPRTYAVAYRAINQLKKAFPNWNPKSFLDFGAGLSSGSIAFKQHFGKTDQIYSVQPSSKMRKLGKYLTQGTGIIYYDSLAALSSQIKKVDLAYCGYVLNQIRPQIITVYLQALLKKVSVGGFVIIVQYGNPFGARIIHEVRKWAIQKKQSIKLIAPCPHSLKCPLSTSNHWCHFDQPVGMYPRQVFGKLPSDNAIKLEKYSYLSIQKISQENQQDDGKQPTYIPQRNQSKQWDRVLFPLIKRGRHFIYTICSKNGRFQKHIASKSHGQSYRLGRRLKWGDYWRFGFRIPNKYRKQRRSGKRLW